MFKYTKYQNHPIVKDTHPETAGFLKERRSKDRDEQDGKTERYRVDVCMYFFVCVCVFRQIEKERDH